MKLILDSSILISYLNKNDSLHDETLGFMQGIIEAKNVSIILPALVLLEVVNVLSRELEEFDKEQLLKALSKYEFVEINLAIVKELAALFKAINLKTSDATIVGVAILTGSVLISWDDQLVKQGKKHITAASPKTFKMPDILNVQY